MRKVNRLRSLVAASACAGALALGVVSAPAASADGSNWAQWSGSCYGWTIWNANQVTGWVNAHDGHLCEVQMQQHNTLNWDAVSVTNAITWGMASTETYWHGDASNGGRLYDYVMVCDETLQICSMNGAWYS